jgi:Rieske Fe-S protein
MSDTTRRAVLAGAAGVTTVSVLAACGDDSASDSSGTGNSNGGGAATTGAAPGSTGGNAGGALAKTADIPVNGGKVFADQGVVVVQPAAGTYKAFSSTCTHQGCAVGSVTNGDIVCPCHMSKFSVTDGSVKSGPAKKPLPEKTIKVDGDSITLA